MEEFERAAEIGEAMGLRPTWVNLIVCVSPASLQGLPDRLRSLAEKQLVSEVATNPVRAAWLTRLRSLLLDR